MLLRGEGKKDRAPGRSPFDSIVLTPPLEPADSPPR